MKTAVLTAAATGAVCVSVFLFLTERYGYRKYDNSGIPDAVSSVCEGGECRLTVVANSGEIDDEGEFAEEVIDMCRENAFRSLRFSTDLEG